MELEELKRDYADYVKEHITSDCLGDLLQTRKNVIFLKSRESSDDEIPIGASKIGGYPDLPPDIPIPELSGYTEKFKAYKLKGLDGITREIDACEVYHDRCSMQLIAQINLSEFAAYDADKKLPEKGMLYFFWSGAVGYLNEMENVVFDGDNREISKVIYYNGDLSRLRRTKPDLPYHEFFSGPLEAERLTPKLNTYLYDEDKLSNIFRGESRECSEMLINEYNKWAEQNGDRLLGYDTASMNMTSGENLLFQYLYGEGGVWDICWFMDYEDLFGLNFEKAYMRWDID